MTNDETRMTKNPLAKKTGECNVISARNTDRIGPTTDFNLQTGSSDQHLESFIL